MSLRFSKIGQFTWYQQAEKTLTRLFRSFERVRGSRARTAEAPPKVEDALRGLTARLCVPLFIYMEKFGGKTTRETSGGERCHEKHTRTDGLAHAARCVTG